MEKEKALSEEIEAPEAVEEQKADSMEHLPEEAYEIKTVNRGDILEGTVVRVSSGEILIDVGWKYEGSVSRSELESMGPEDIEKIQVGDEVLAYVVNPEGEDGRIVLSLRQAELEKEWRSLEKLFEAEEVFEEKVTDYNKGGLLVQLGQVRGFVPASQLISPGGAERRAKMVGQQLRLKIIELDRKRNRLILSERDAQRQWRQKQKARLLTELQEGDIRHGKVSSLCDFGAFVDLGGTDGLVHVSELSWGRVSHPREVLQVGEEVEVYVTNVDSEKGRIGLSLKHLQSDPWTQVEEKYTEGQLVEGTITKLADFGAFARIKGDDIEGLVHVSELANERVAHPKEVIKKGDTLTLRIVRIDPDRHRMGLSLKRVAQAKYADLDWRVEGAAMLEEEGREVEVESGGQAGEPAQAKSEEEEESPEANSVKAAGP